MVVSNEYIRNPGMEGALGPGVIRKVSMEVRRFELVL